MRRVLVIVGLALLTAGCQQRMADNPKRDPLSTSPLFADQASARPPVAGTVAQDDDTSGTATALPAALDLGLLQHGRERFEIFCTPCHGYAGHADGRVVQRGFPHPPDLHSPALISAPDSVIFDAITNGYGAMAPYRDRVPVADRWAIVAYVRALQYSGQVPVADLSDDLRQRLAGGAK